LPEAAQLYRETMESYPEDVWARNGLAEVLKARGQLPEAERLYRETMQSYPENVVVRTGLAGVLVSAGKPADALDLLPVVAEPGSHQDWVAHHMRAMILLRMGERNQALPMLRLGYTNCPLPSDTDYYRSALAFDAIRYGAYEDAEDLLREPSSFAENERVLEIARVHLAAARNAASARPKFRLILAEPTTTEQVKRTLTLIDSRFGVESNAAPASEHPRLDTEIFEAETELASVAA
jgi:tetratricopeptide (TPR) repeat protein